MASRIPASVANDGQYKKMVRGDLYWSFGPELTAARNRCARACKRFNAASGEEVLTRRQQVTLWRDILGDKSPLPPPAPTEEEEEALFKNDPVVAGSITVDYGIHLTVGAGTYINFNFTVLDTCHVKIGARVLFGPNVSIFTASHPVDPDDRAGMEGPELGAPITIGDDCWIGGSVIVLAGVTIGDGCTIGAGSVVTKSIEPNSVAVGSPARVIKKIERKVKN